ncbi:hypothetical protein [Neolewinella persica]|uniref:hypothetical protein n=1 Tax=Neolewinella persica TaxID=70998 RepID=UPI00036ED316|nr:hypothetical protein [Neolewinella persica]
MRNFFSVFLLIATSILFTSCGADGNLNAELIKGYVDQFQEEIMPTKEEFRQMAEQQIARMPAGEQAEAREALAETLANWPTSEQLDSLVDGAVSEMPTRAEFDKAMDELAREMPGGGSLQKAIEEAMDEIPQGEELNKAVEKSLEEMEKSAKETRKAIKENR